MNILIIDDDQMKERFLASLLLKDNPENKIRWFDNYDDATQFIDRNRDYIDLILLDWCFPDYSASRPQYAMGRHVLTYMNANGYSNNVIICSSDVVSIDKNEFPFVKGAICYYPDKSIMNQINDYLNKSEDIEENKDNYVRSLRPMKPNECTGYKRRMSSQPWWQK